jgi:hypothetical protein
MYPRFPVQLVLPWRWQQCIAPKCRYLSTRACSWPYIAEDSILCGNEPSSSVEHGNFSCRWVTIKSLGRTQLHGVNRLFLPLKKNIFSCWKNWNTLIWLLHAILQVTSKREALEEKSTGARNDYLLSLAAANAHQTRYFVVDLQSTMQVGCHLVCLVCHWISGYSIWEDNVSSAFS